MDFLFDFLMTYRDFIKFLYNLRFSLSKLKCVFVQLNRLRLNTLFMEFRVNIYHSIVTQLDKFIITSPREIVCIKSHVQMFIHSNAQWMSAIYHTFVFSRFDISFNLSVRDLIIKLIQRERHENSYAADSLCFVAPLGLPTRI